MGQFIPLPSPAKPAAAETPDLIGRAKAALTDRVWWRLFASPKWKANRPMKLLNSFRWSTGIFPIS